MSSAAVWSSPEGESLSPRTETRGLERYLNTLRDRWWAILLAVVLCAGAAIAYLAVTPRRVASCDLVSSPSGSDSAVGSAAAPFASAQKLVDSLSAGQVGCLRGGSYAEDVTIRKPGFTLTGWPGEQATVQGHFRVMQGADNVTVTALNLDGRNSANLASPLILANNVTFSHNDVTNHATTICFMVGAFHWATVVASQDTITGNRIHDCGRLPSTNYDHAIYVENTVGLKITDNVLYDNADRAVQLYPQSIGTLVSGNIIDGNGEGVIFSGEPGAVSSGNVVENNVITNSNIRSDIESYFAPGTPAASGNVARNNCVFGPRTVNTKAGGLVAQSNLTGDPLYVDRSNHNYRLQSGSPCAGILAGANPRPPRTRSPRPHPRGDLPDPSIAHRK